MLQLPTILLIEDDATIARLVAEYLEKADYRVLVSSAGDSGLETFHREQIDLLILDLNLPGKNGFEICREIRKTSTTPIFILSARSSEDDRVHALELGADDYIGKPFSARELVARVNRHFARLKHVSHGVDIVECGNIRMDLSEYTATVQGLPVRLTKTEFEILSHLLRHL